MHRWTVLLWLLPASACGDDSPADASGTDATSTGSSTSATTLEVDGTESSEGGAVDDTAADAPACTICDDDEDRDSVPVECDNAPEHANPTQGDIDGDDIGDVRDSCPLVAGSSDTDRDGVGDDCDTCRREAQDYNKENATILEFPDYMRVRAIPDQTDTDGDGIGDVCDNCVLVPNCERYGPDNRWYPGDPIAFDDWRVCQVDDNDMVGTACEPAGPDDFDPAVAAGPIGLGAAADFDQDGIANVDDACPRQPLGDRIACLDDSDCPASRACALAVGLCNHEDTDEDGIGDICDSCPGAPNPEQIVEGLAQEDDPDDDFVGNACETHATCSERHDPRRMSFHAVSAHGTCCTVELVAQEATGDLVRAVTGKPLVAWASATNEDLVAVPIRLGCTAAEEANGACRALPASVAARPGVLELAPDCADALIDAYGTADPSQNVLLSPDDFGGDPRALWDTMCFLPQLDQDFDGLGDTCDLCPFDFDPDNVTYVDSSGNEWPNDGRACNGSFAIENKCDALGACDDPSWGCVPG